VRTLSIPITTATLLHGMPSCARVVAQFIGPINEAMMRWDIITAKRIAAFLAEVAHESTQLTQMRENLNYSAPGLVQTWPRRFRHALPGEPITMELRNDGYAIAEAFARRPADIANLVYANRLGNGDWASGDGWRFRGGGGIHVTGRANYGVCSEATCGSADVLMEHPELVAQPKYAMDSAAWFFASNGCNELADKQDIDAISRRVNGGSHGLVERRQYYKRFCALLGVE
jgi:putative chitinase